jgi:hypothetical protein
MYPPYQIPLGYFGALTLAGLLWRDRQAGRAISPRRIGILFMAVALASVVMIVVLRQGQSAFTALMSSVYPGQRKIDEAREFWKIFMNNALVLRFHQSNVKIGNICESAGFIFLFPLVIPMALVARGMRGRRAAFVALAAFCGLVTLWEITDGLTLLGKLTLLDRVPNNRFNLALGLADRGLLAAFFGMYPGPAVQSTSRRGRWLLVATWIAFLVCVGWTVHREIPIFSRLPWALEFLALAAVQLAVAYSALRGRAHGLAALVALAFVMTAWFNPVVRGGYEYFSDNPLSLRIRALDAEKGGGSLWATFNDIPMANLIRALGIRSYNGLETYPSLKHWAALDPANAQTYFYNRIGYSCFEFGATPAKIEFVLHGLDYFCARLNPDHPLFAQLGVDYLLVRKKEEVIPPMRGYSQVYEDRFYLIFRRR